jgi:predicted TIM-barrel fold metal-dependent hydrolase
MTPPGAAPPDPHPRKPKFTLPPGACDCQIHLFGPAAQYPVDAGSRYRPADALPETNIALQDALGLSHAIIVSGGAYGLDHRHLSDTLTRFPGRFRGVAFMSEASTPAEFDRLTRLGVRGLRFISPGHGMKLPPISEATAARAAEYGWHVHFYPHRTDITEHADRLLALPNDVIVLDHFAHIPAEGGLDQEAVRTVLRLLDTGRVWVRLSAPMRCTEQDFPYANVTPLARKFVGHAPERMLWGTDWPHVNMHGRPMPNDGDLVNLLLDWADDDATRNRILADNPRKLYGLPGKK